MATIKENIKKPQGLRLIVKKGKEDEPFLDLMESIKSYEFKLNSADGSLTKDRNIMIELKITGAYREEVADEVSKFMTEWALDESGAAYKYVEFSKFDEKQVKKRYVFPKAFVVDYKETDGGTENVGFELFIKENKDNRRDFQVFINEILEDDGNE